MVKFITKKASLLFILLSVVLLAFLLAACNNAQGTSSKIEVTDLSGRTVSFDKPAEKVIALAASDCEILYAIDAQDTLVGRGTYCDYPAEVTKLKDYGSGDLTNIEELVAANPDVVLMCKTGFTLDQVNAIENAGLKTLVNEANTFDDTYKYIEQIGKVTGKEDNAKKLVDEMKSSIADFSSKAKAKNLTSNNSVYYEVSPLQYGLWTAGSNTFMNEICDILNLKNCFSDCDGWAEISQEQVIKRNPDYIISVTMYFGDGPKPADEIMSRAGWSNIAAVKNKNVVNVDNSSVTRSGPRLIEAINEIYNMVYE